ncbi:hypothetical protein MTO96_001115 [Rhipicephalus appendiculatus]
MCSPSCFYTERLEYNTAKTKTAHNETRGTTEASSLDKRGVLYGTCPQQPRSQDGDTGEQGTGVHVCGTPGCVDEEEERAAESTAASTLAKGERQLTHRGACWLGSEGCERRARAPLANG